MNLLVVVSVLLFFVWMASGIALNFVVWTMGSKVIGKRDQDDHVSYVTNNTWKPRGWWTISEYRRFYPDGRLHLWLIALFAMFLIGFVDFFGTVFLMGTVFPTAGPGQ